MDEYAEYYYRREPSIRSLKYGNISEQKKIKEKLHCKSFKWFMKNIAYDVLEKYPLPSKNIVWGEVRIEEQDRIQCFLCLVEIEHIFDRF